jgi:hypothetical protein
MITLVSLFSVYINLITCTHAPVGAREFHQLQLQLHYSFLLFYHSSILTLLPNNPED